MEYLFDIFLLLMILILRRTRYNYINNNKNIHVESLNRMQIKSSVVTMWSSEELNWSGSSKATQPDKQIQFVMWKGWWMNDGGGVENTVKL